MMHLAVLKVLLHSFIVKGVLRWVRNDVYNGGDVRAHSYLTTFPLAG